MDNFQHQFAEHFGPNSGKSDSERYIDFIESVLEVTLSDAQKEIVRAGAENRKTAIQSSNGLGKSYALSCLALAFLYCNPEATVLITSASYSTMEDTLYKPMADLLSDAQDRLPLPGKALKAPPRIEFDGKDDHFLKCISTSNAGDLEGRHNDRILVIVEECDKPSVTDEVIDSSQSSITGSKDRMVAIGNPPKSKANSFHEIRNDPTWETMQFSSFDSRNVLVDIGEHEGERLPGVVDLSTMKDDWRSWNGEPWPGVEEARERRDGLDERWYRRRLGIVPPSDASAVRPFYASQVDDATSEWSPSVEASGASGADSQSAFETVGVDLATNDGADSTVAIGVNGSRAEVLYDIENPTAEQNEMVLEEAQRIARSGAICDAIRETNFLDSIDADPVRFKGSYSAENDEEFRNRRSESYFVVGDWLDDGQIEPDSPLANQLYEVAEVAEAEIKALRSSETYMVTPKDEISKYIDANSPDYVDSFAMALWLLKCGNTGRRVETELSMKELFN